MGGSRVKRERRERKRKQKPFFPHESDREEKKEHFFLREQILSSKTRVEKRGDFEKSFVFLQKKFQMAEKRALMGDTFRRPPLVFFSSLEKIAFF